MISFGFAIDKFLHGLQEAATIRLRRPEVPRDLGLFLTALGIASLVAGLVQHVNVTRRLGFSPWRTGPAPYVAGLVVILGVLVLISILSRGGPF